MLRKPTLPGTSSRMPGSRITAPGRCANRGEEAGCAVEGAVAARVHESCFANAGADFVHGYSRPKA